MLRYFLIFGIIVASIWAIGPSASCAALPQPSEQRNVNSYAEATSGIPGVPINQVIHRYGRVVASAVRMKNRDKEPSACLAKTPLSEFPVRIASAWYEGVFGTPARQGTDSGPVARGGGPVAGPVKQRGPRAVPGPQAPEDLSPPTEAPKRLPFQGAGTATTSPDTSADSAKPEKSKESMGVDGARKHLVEPSKQKAKRARTTRKKPAARQSHRREEAVQATTDGSMPPARRRSHPKQPGFDSAAMPAPPVGSTSKGGLPPLPPALPYNPSATRSPAASTVTPRSDGTVMARIPSASPMPGAGSPVPPPITAAPSGQLTPRPLHPNNPISGFIMDSFGEPAKPVPVQAPGTTGVQVQTRQRSQSQQTSTGRRPGVLGQLSSDVQQLGAGIKGVFERLVPSQ